MRRIPLLIAAALAALSQAGCPACYDEIRLLTIDFEGCDGACDWTVSGGGTAEIRETIHPGEHGLYLEGELSAVAEVDATVDYYAAHWPELQMVTDCGDGVRLGLEWIDGDRYSLSVVLDGAQTSWQGSYRDIALSLPSASADAIEITELRLVNRFGGCSVDQIRLLHPEGC